MSDTPSTTPPAPESGSFSRRNFIRSAALAGTAASLASCDKEPFHTRPALYPGFKSPRPGRDLNVAIVGCGEQGNALTVALERIADPSLMPRILAVADIDRVRAASLAGRIKNPPDMGGGGLEQDCAYYRDMDELLEKEGDKLDAVILAVPDWIHHELTIKGLRAGLHVYCEKMMSNRIEWARQMVQAANETGKLLQIGHQRRSNPRYLALRNGIIDQHQGLGRMTHAYAQWNRGLNASTPLKVGESKSKLKLAQEYGYGSVREMRNWRHYRKYGGGIISDLGAHQIDLFNWFYQAMPKKVQAMGGIDFWTEDNQLGTYELPDNVMVMYEYEMPGDLSPDGKPHVARGFYQTLTTTGFQGFHERFNGTMASVEISEVPRWNSIFRETYSDNEDLAGNFMERWQAMLDKGLIYPIPYDLYWKGRRAWESARPFGRQPPAWYKTPKEEDDALRGGYVDSRVSAPPPIYGLGTNLNAPAHQPHLLNFFEAVEKNDKSLLNCPGEEAFRTAVTVLKVYEALENGGQYEFKPEDFAV